MGAAQSAPPASRRVLGVSLKMYFDHERTVQWCRDVARIARQHPAVTTGAAEIFVMPSFPSLEAAGRELEGVAEVGAQNIATEDAGAFTGEVSGPQLAQVGCRFAEIGHAERRLLFGETGEVIAQKTAAAVRAGLTPVLCVGEPEHSRTEDAAAACVEQIDAACATLPSRPERLVVAYEPQWAIGQPEPAPTDYVQEVSTRLRRRADRGDVPTTILYGGSAGPGLLERLGDSVDGLFLGRFAHDPQAMRSMLDEVQELSARPGTLTD